MLTLLISARDPSAARNQIALYEYIQQQQQQKNIIIIVVASEPAASIFKSKQIYLNEQVDIIIEKEESKSAYLLLKEAQKIIEKYQPDAIITGLSGPKIGIDEALVKISKGLIPSYLLQDFWGECNTYFEVYADTFFVIDAIAEKESKRKFNVHSIVSGMPKYDAYQLLCSQDRKEQSTQRVTFFGQPLWEYNGYKETLESFLISIKKIDKVELYYRPHPSEEKNSYKNILELSKSTEVTIKLDREISPEVSMIKSYAVFSLFSLTCYDYVCLNSLREDPLGMACYLQFNHEILAEFQNELKSSFFTKVFPDFGLIINREEDLEKMWSKLLDDNYIQKYHQNQKKYSTLNQNSSATILHTILRDINKNEIN